jgi:hypothetical protein
MFQAVVLSRLRTTRSGEDPSEAQARLERAARVQRREATVHFVTGRTDARLSARRACSTVTTWRQPDQLVEVEIDGFSSYGCTGSARS